jgi:hypothetical protein
MECNCKNSAKGDVKVMGMVYYIINLLPLLIIKPTTQHNPGTAQSVFTPFFKNIWVNIYN